MCIRDRENAGAIAMAEVVKGHPQLNTLLLESNNIGERGLVALADAIAESHSLTQVTLWGNSFNNQSPESARAFYVHKERLTQVQLDFSLYVVDGVPMAAKA
eukprot:TRINITY_DN24394_c0_g1_i1.p2 TRINITY_DN24394_c0_g1~~TRINITY_DN24394_c0_g1_i1.p2  ORF type:complete len:102 (-),score=30.30 TRINITY_DN24394_c0_g1_i1:195-500(-)